MLGVFDPVVCQAVLLWLYALAHPLAYGFT